MANAILIESNGGPEVLKQVQYQLPDPKENEIQIRHTAIEVNFIDIYHRKGLYELNYNPKILGISAVGIVEKVGSKVKGYKEDDRVGYATAKGGAYCTIRNIDADLVFQIPPDVTDDIAASAMLKGLTAHYLVHRTYLVREGTAVLIHAAAGGVGKLLAQWSRYLGSYVIGTVGSDEKKQIALDNGCHHVINYNSEDLVAKVMEYTQNIGVNAVYDGIGKTTIDRSLKCPMNMGIVVLYGAASGPVEAINTSDLGAKSLFFTRPRIDHYKSNRMELLLSAAEVFDKIINGVLKIPTPTKMPLADAAKAHQLLESRQAVNSIVLIP